MTNTQSVLQLYFTFFCCKIFNLVSTTDEMRISLAYTYMSSLKKSATVESILGAGGKLDFPTENVFWSHLIQNIDLSSLGLPWPRQ